MASPAIKKSNATGLRDLLSVDMLWLAWLPIFLIGVFHYATGSHHHWAHDVLRRLYYIPILFAAFSRGARGGIAVALTASLSYAPHAFLIMGSHDPATTLNKLLEIVLYNAIGLLAGVLADREARRRRQAEQALSDERRMADQLVRAGRLAALGELVAGIAHEIKNPLHTIKGTAEIVDEIVPKDAEQSEMWALLRREVDRLEQIAERFLSFARPSAPNLTAQTFGQAYQRIVELLRAQFHQTPDIALEVGALSKELAATTVQVDPDQIAQVALNIGSNALTAMGTAGTLRVRATLGSAGGDQVVALRMENTGPAIPDDDLERIFDPFHTRSERGTGLGLAIAGRIAETHGGHIGVENTGEERGVAFTLYLPVAVADTVAAR